MDNLKNHFRLKMDNEKHLIVKKRTIDIIPTHWHNFFEVEIVLSGKGRFIINDTAYDIIPNRIFFLTHTDIHCAELESSLEILNITFDQELVGEKILPILFNKNTEKAYDLNEYEYKRLVSATELLKYEYETDGECQKELLHYILTCVFSKTQFDNSIQFTNTNYEHYQGIKNAIVYIEMHFRENITLDSIAAQAGYNPTYFSELFKKTTGETYIQKITKLRIGHAKTLLANGFSVSDACFLSGFGSLSNFLTSFKKNCHMTPKKFRAMHTSRSEE